MQRIHGLVIRAGVPLPGLTAAHVAGADVELELADRLAAPIPARVRYRAAAPDDTAARIEVVDDVRGHVAFRYGDGTAFDVEHRTHPARIRAAIAPGQNLEDLAAYLYGPVLGFLLRAWGRLALHASCVRIGDGVVLLAGPPGAGKSTTAAALAMRGAAVLSDDLTALHLDNAGAPPLAWPSFDHLRLWPDGERVVLGASGRLDRITPTWDKRRFPLEGSAFADGALPVRAILVLHARRGGRPVVRTLGASRALVTLATLTYANYLLDHAMRAHELQQLAALVRAVSVRAVTPPVGHGNLDALCEAVVHAADEGVPVPA